MESSVEVEMSSRRPEASEPLQGAARLKAVLAAGFAGLKGRPTAATAAPVELEQGANVGLGESRHPPTEESDPLVIQDDPEDYYNDRFNQPWSITNPPPNPKWLPVFLSTLEPGTAYSYWASDGTFRHGVKPE